MYIHIKVRVQKAIRQETGSLSVKGPCVHVVCARACAYTAYANQISTEWV